MNRDDAVFAVETIRTEAAHQRAKFAEYAAMGPGGGMTLIRNSYERSSLAWDRVLAWAEGVLGQGTPVDPTPWPGETYAPEGERPRTEAR